jgi:hypothetical protein
MSGAFPTREVAATLLCLVLAVAPTFAFAFQDTSRPNPELGPTPVEVEIYLLDVDAIDSASQSFEANVYFVATWRDPRLVDEAQGRTISRPLDQVWNPRLQILNQQRLWSSMSRIVNIKPDGTVKQRARVWGSFSQPLDLREFPFDTQTISIHVVAADYEPNQVTLLPSPRTGIGDEFSVADWEVSDWRISTEFETSDPAEAQSPRIALFLEVNRLRGYYWLKVIAPLILIVAMSWAVFWIDPKELSTKISITITAMLTLIAYRFAIDSNLPAISYMTRMDLFILFSTILVYASLVAVLTTAAYSRKGRDGIAKAIDRGSRWGFPLFFFASWLISMFLPI